MQLVKVYFKSGIYADKQVMDFCDTVMEIS